jgi:lipoprotein-anchoring transpeptidase ErfK/SrfK
MGATVPFAFMAPKHEDKIRTADSHGCVGMRNANVAELFMLVDDGTHVIIEE